MALPPQMKRPKSAFPASPPGFTTPPRKISTGLHEVEDISVPRSVPLPIVLHFTDEKFFYPLRPIVPASEIGFPPHPFFFFVRTTIGIAGNGKRVPDKRPIGTPWTSFLFLAVSFKARTANRLRKDLHSAHPHLLDSNTRPLPLPLGLPPRNLF